jgi:Xaa-Pro dipeptidase
MNIAEVQEQLQKSGLDGWLLYDFKRNNSLAWNFLEIPEEKHTTRRFFYWIPAKGDPIRIVHEIEMHTLDHLSGEKKIYFRWQTLEEILKEILKGSSKIAMEYSPKCAVPYVSKVDAGTMELVQGCGVKVVSSAPFLLKSTLLSETQVKSLKEAAAVVEMALEASWKTIQEALVKGNPITDCDVQKLILEIFDKNDCSTDAPPHCAINADSADPHFVPDKSRPVSIKKADFILIDLWCKKNRPDAVYADVTRLGVAAAEPTKKQKEVFDIVRKAQRNATEFLRKQMAEGKEVKGYEVDQVARKVIEDAGFGKYFVHRLGHNIMTDLHGPGTHFDSLETYDDRPVLKGALFSCEPGIYLPGEFGVRLEYDLYIDMNGQVQIIGGEQDNYVLFGSL